jgi:hypothetical protein
MYYENNLNCNVQKKSLFFATNIFAKQKCPIKKKLVPYFETEKWLVIDIWKNKMKIFEKNVKNYSASEHEGRTDESPAIINPAGSVSVLQSIQNTIH